MKVCVVSTNIVPYFLGDMFGGAERQAAMILRSLQARGIQCSIVTSDLPPGRELPYPAYNAFSSADGLPGLRFFTPRLSGIVGALRRADADVYYQRNAGMISGVTSWFCRKEKRVFVYGAGSDIDFDRRRACGSARDRAMYFHGLKRADGVVVQNGDQEVAARRILETEMVVIPNGVEHRPRSHKGDEVIWIGGMTQVKRPQIFLDMVEALPDIRFTMVGGPAPSQMEFGRQINERASRLANLTAVGRVEPDQARDYVSRAALLVNTSAVEGFPNAFLEAWDAETPVVSFVDVDGLMNEYQVGVVCRDEDEMKSALIRLMGDRSTREAMGGRAARLVQERFAIDKLGERYQQFFVELLSRRRGRSAG